MAIYVQNKLSPTGDPYGSDVPWTNLETGEDYPGTPPKDQLYAFTGNGLVPLYSSEYKQAVSEYQASQPQGFLGGAMDAFKQAAPGIALIAGAGLGYGALAGSGGLGGLGAEGAVDASLGGSPALTSSFSTYGAPEAVNAWTAEAPGTFDPAAEWAATESAANSAGIPWTQAAAPVVEKSFNAAADSGILSSIPGFVKSGLVAAGGGALLSALTGGKGLSGGSTSTTNTTSIPPMTQEEKDLIDLNKQLAQKQLASIDQASAYQKQYADLALATLQQQQKASDAYNLVNTPEKIAADAELQRQINTLQLTSAQQAADRAAKLGPVQQELLQLQLDQLRQGGRATPEQLAAIKAAADAGIASGNFDIDAATQRGIGLIADQLANSRGLRLTDSPMSSEAALLAREGVIQKGSLEKNLRAGQATAALNYPLAVQQVQTAGIQGQQSIADAAANFQAQLQQQAYNNRLALTGSASTGGIGLAGIGSGTGALSALTQAQINSGSTTSNVNKGIGLSDIGNLVQGLGSGYLAYSKLAGT